MITLGLVGLLLLTVKQCLPGGCRENRPSGLACLMLAVIPLFAAIAELMLPGGEALPARDGWASRSALPDWPTRVAFASQRSGRGHHSPARTGNAPGRGRRLGYRQLVSRRARLPVNSFVAAAWQMLIAGAFNLLIGTLWDSGPNFT